MVSLNESFDGSNDGKLEHLFLGDSLGSTDVKVLGFLLGDVDGITLGLDFGTERVFLYVTFYGCNDGKLECLLLGD